MQIRIKCTTPNNDGVCRIICKHGVSSDFAKTLVWKREHDVILWRYEQRTSSNNDNHAPLVMCRNSSFYSRFNNFLPFKCVNYWFCALCLDDFSVWCAWNWAKPWSNVQFHSPMVPTCVKNFADIIVEHCNASATYEPTQCTSLIDWLIALIDLLFHTTKAAMSNPIGWLSQKLRHCLYQGRTLNDLLWY